MYKFIKSKRKAASTVEMGLLLGMIAVALIFSVRGTGAEIESIFGSTEQAMEDVQASSGTQSQSNNLPPSPADLAKSVEMFVVEIQGHYSSNTAAVNEIRFYLEDDSTAVTYTIPHVFDSVRNGNPAYWGGGIWGSSNLQDGQTSYGSNGQGASNSTAFMYNSPGNRPDVWARFAGQFSGAQSIGRILVSAGSSVEERVPYAIRVYKVDPSNFDVARHIRTQTTDDLALLGTVTYANATDNKTENINF